MSGRCYWLRNRAEEVKVEGIVVVFTWASISEAQLNDFIALYSSLGWNSLVCRSDYLNPFIPERATSLAFSVLGEIAKELRAGLCPVVFSSFSGGSKACMYKVFQIIEGCSEVELNLEDGRLVASCISGQIYDSDPVDFADDLGARFALHRSILRMPGSSKLLSLFAKGVTLSLDALFLTRFGSQNEEYWQTLYSSVGLGAPFLILCSENDGVAPYSTLCNFAQHLKDVGGDVNVVKWTASPHLGVSLIPAVCQWLKFPMLVNFLLIYFKDIYFYLIHSYLYRYVHVIGHYKYLTMQYTSAVAQLLEQAASVFSHKIQNLGEKSRTDYMQDVISDLICDLQNAAVDSNQSFRRVAVGPNDHFFQPSSSAYQNNKEFGSLQEEQKERSPSRSSPCMHNNSVLGQVLFNVCVPKTVEGWDIKFSGALNGEPLASLHKRSPFSGIKHRSRL